MTRSAVVLVGGRGERLRPLTDTCPKPLLPVGGVPIIERQLRRLAEAGVEEVALATGYRAEMFEDVDPHGMLLVHSWEREPLGTGGAVREALCALGTPAQALVLYGDILSDHSIGEQMGAHLERDADATLHVVRVGDASAFGSVEMDASWRVTRLREKDPEATSTWVNAGCYALSGRAALRLIPRRGACSMERDVFPRMARAYAWAGGTAWVDAGTHEAYARAQELFGEQVRADLLS